MSVLALGEIRRGIEMILKKDSTQAKVFQKWLHTLTITYGDRILPITTEIAIRWGAMGATRNHSPVDALLGATAAEHGLTMATRNVSDFKEMGIRVINPFQF